MVGGVVEVRDGVLRLEPLCRGISYRPVAAREVVAHWRKTGRRGPVRPRSTPGAEPVQVPREELLLLRATRSGALIIIGCLPLRCLHLVVTTGFRLSQIEQDAEL
jgi:hypothetical protein